MIEAFSHQRQHETSHGPAPLEGAICQRKEVMLLKSYKEIVK